MLLPHIKSIQKYEHVIAGKWVRAITFRYWIIQSVSRLVEITAEGDFLGLCDQKFRINMCPILDGYGVTSAWNLKEGKDYWQ